MKCQCESPLCKSKLYAGGRCYRCYFGADRPICATCNFLQVLTDCEMSSPSDTGYRAKVAELLEATEGVDEAVLQSPFVRTRVDSVFAATDRDDGITPMQEEVRALVRETENLLEAGETGDPLLLNVTSLRLLEDTFGLPAMLGDSGDWRDRYSLCLDAWKELRYCWAEGDAVTYTAPGERPTEELIEAVRVYRRRLNTDLDGSEVGAQYDAVVRELTRRGVDVARVERR